LAGSPSSIRFSQAPRERAKPSSEIAQARIAYCGRGQITDIQQPRYGQQVMDVLLPF
jgi:hypothetical protein